MATTYTVPNSIVCGKDQALEITSIGDMTFKSGYGSTHGGPINLSGGSSTNGKGGNLYIFNGLVTTNTTGGSIYVNGGTSMTLSGSVSIEGHTVNKGYYSNNVSRILQFTNNSLTLPVYTLPVFGSIYNSIYCEKQKKYVSIVYNSGTYYSMTSLDGIGWTSYAMNINNSPCRTIFASYLDLYLNVFYSGNILIYSSNGISWATTTIPLSNLNGEANIAVSNELKLMVLFKYGTYTYTTSKNGINWTSYTLSSDSSISTPIFTNEWISPLGSFIALSSTESTGLISKDGYTWSAFNYFPNVGNLIGIAYDIRTSLICVVHVDKCAASYDGLNWTSNSLSPNYWMITWIPDLSLFLLSCSINVVHYSYNGLNWTVVPSILPSTSYAHVWSSYLCKLIVIGPSALYNSNTVLNNVDKNVNFNGITTNISGNELVVGYNANKINVGTVGTTTTFNENLKIDGSLSYTASEFNINKLTSDIGSDPIYINTNVTFSYTDTATCPSTYQTYPLWIDVLSIVIILTPIDNSTELGGISPITQIHGGYTAITRPSVTNSQPVSVCWSKELNMAVIAVTVPNNVTNTITFVYSYNGTNWNNASPTTHDIPGTYDVKDICWCKHLNVFATVLGSGNGVLSISKIFTSNNGINWTTTSYIPSGSVGLNSVCSGFDKIVAVSNSDSGLIVWTTNATNWNSTTISGEIVTYNVIIYCEELELFCITKLTGGVTTLNKFLTKITNNSNVSCNYICYASEIKLIAAISTDNLKWIYSHNGINWTTTNMPYIENFSGLAWSNKYRKFILPKSNGTNYACLINTPTFQNVTNKSIILGTRGITDHEIDGSVVNIGTRAYDLSIGRYARNIVIGSNIFTRKYFYRATHNSVGSTYTGKLQFYDNYQMFSTLPVVSAASFQAGKYGIYASTDVNTNSFYAPYSGLYLFTCSMYFSDATGVNYIGMISFDDVTNEVNILRSYWYTNVTNYACSTSSSGVAYLNVGDGVNFTGTRVLANGQSYNNVSILLL